MCKYKALCRKSLHTEDNHGETSWIFSNSVKDALPFKTFCFLILLLTLQTEKHFSYTVTVLWE